MSETPKAIRDRMAAGAGISLFDLLGRGQGRALVEARQDIALALWRRCPELSLDDVAKLIGRRDHGAAQHAILAGARRAGRPAARVSELREGAEARGGLDLAKLAYAAAAWRDGAGLLLKHAAERAGIGANEWRKVENGRSVSAETLLSVCRAIGFNPLRLLPPVSRETNAKGASIAQSSRAVRDGAHG